MSYYSDQLNRIKLGIDFPARIKVIGEDSSTNWMDLHEESARDLIAWLQSKYLPKHDHPEDPTRDDRSILDRLGV